MIKFTNYISEVSNIDWRGCLMLTMPDEISRLISAWSDSHIDKKFLAGDGRESYSHCTVLYGFDQDTNIDTVENQLNSYSPIDLSLGCVKRFPASEHRPDSDCIVIEVNASKQLRDLHTNLKDIFSVKTTFPTYNPHITIAYIKPGSLQHLDGDVSFDGFNVKSNEMTYSTGSSENRSRKALTFEEFQAKNQILA